METENKISRRDFLRLTGVSALGLASIGLPKEIADVPPEENEWPRLTPDFLPSEIKRVVESTPQSRIDKEGYLSFPDGKRVPLAQTRWNRENDKSGDRLREGVPWALILHWYGDEENFDKTIGGYLRGFDSLRYFNGVPGRTSAHFLIGGELPYTGNVEKDSKNLAILQTQKPTFDGVPLEAAHLGPLGHIAHSERRQYFVRAFYELGFYKNPTVLQEMFDGEKIAPNKRTIGIEIAGENFDYPGNYPTDQKIANTLSVVWAVMKRYKIESLSLLGHNEIQLNKSDPGKKFMAHMRFLIGVKALVENDNEMRDLVFGRFTERENGDKEKGVKAYFDFVRNYLVLTGRPKEVFEWEAKSKYWQVYGSLFKEKETLIADSFRMPVNGGPIVYGRKFTIPEFHEGIDINIQETNKIDEDLGLPIYLVANGECIFAEKISGCGLGNTVMFRHRLPEGSEVISIYGHLDSISGIKVGKTYKIGEKIGGMGKTNCQLDSHLHFAIAYGATWDTNLKEKPYVPNRVTAAWVKRRYLEPIGFINHRKEEERERELKKE